MATTRSRQHDSAVRRLRELVIGGTFRPGERISELAAVDRLGASRTPVRLALQTLAHEGLLEARANGGFVVRDYSLTDVLDAIALRGVLEGMAARLASERSSGGIASRKLNRITSQIDRLLDDTNSDEEDVFESYVALNQAFHTELLALARSPMLERSLEQVTRLPFASAGALVKASVDKDRTRKALLYAQFQHKALVDSIARGEGTRAAMVAQEHAQTAASAVRELAGSEDLERVLRGSHLVRWIADEP